MIHIIMKSIFTDYIFTFLRISPDANEKTHARGSNTVRLTKHLKRF